MALLALAPACGGARPPAPAHAAGGAEDAILALRYQVASAPQDVAARVALARLEHEAGRPGAAFEHLTFVARGAELAPAAQRMLAGLYARRFGERLAAGDGAAYRDAEAALGLDPEAAPAPAMRAEGYFLAALAALRRGNRAGNREAAGLLARAAALAPADARHAAARRGDAAGEVDLAVLGQAALWLHRGGARRAALDLLELYLHRGGRDRVVLEALVAEWAWWGGARARPGLLLVRELAAAGVSTCPLASTPADLGCDASLEALAAAGGALARTVWQRAERLFWYTDDPRQAAAWTLLALRAWLDGDGAWLPLMRRRMAVRRLLASPDVPAHVMPALWRAAGRPAEAAAALDRVLAAVLGAGGASALPDAGAHALVVAEAAMQGRPAEIIDALRARLPGAGDLGWECAVRHARALDDGERLAALLRERPAAARAALRRGGDLGPLAWGAGQGGQALAWWWRFLDSGDQGPLTAGRDAVWRTWQTIWPPPSGWRLPRGVPVPVPMIGPPAVLADDHEEDAAVQGALADIARAYVHEPAVADRLARALVQRAVSVGRHGPAVAALFAALGDPARALAWWEHVAAESPVHPPYQLALGIAAAAAGDMARARVHVTTAAARAGDAGAIGLHAAGCFLRQGQALDAIAEAGRALSLTAPSQRGPVLALLATAMADLGRDGDAAAMRAAWLEVIPPAFRDRARRAIQAPGAAVSTNPSPTTAAEPAAGSESGAAPDTAAGSAPAADAAPAAWDPGAWEPATAVLRSGPDPDPARALHRLRVALAWHPDHVGLHQALLARLAPGSEAHARALAALLGVALSARPARARAAFQVLARTLTAMGAEDRARWARAAQRALEPALGPSIPQTPARPGERSAPPPRSRMAPGKAGQQPTPSGSSAP